MPAMTNRTRRGRRPSPVATLRSTPIAMLVVVAALALPNVVAAAPLRVPGVGPSAVVAAAPTSAKIKLSLRASGLTKPVLAVSARDGTGRIFIVEQTGRIKIYRNGTILATPFLSIPSLVSTVGEQGLLGLAFHPSFSSNRKLYVNYTDVNGDTVIREYKASSAGSNVVATSTARTILKVDQPYANHNGGMLAFGKDGYLYIGMGDGGSGGDPGNRAQNINSLLGKILRIDVNHTTSTTNYVSPSSNPYVGRDGLNAIWQIGLRNPWRFSFDRVTGSLWIGDVGQNNWEEIDRGIRISTGPGRGVNWGWRVLEGTHCYNPSSGCSTSGRTKPLTEYSHDGGRCSVTGGFVYRGTQVPALVGGYVFADYCSGEIFVIDSTAPPGTRPTLLLDTDARK